ncbi:MAG: ABC transporter ATP-binding protein [Planctomycetota bacterium]
MNPILKISNLNVEYPRRPEAVRALHGVSFELNRGETVAWVGESGCGKTTLANAVLGLLPNGGRIVSGSICWNGTEIANANDRHLCKIRGSEIAYIPQEPALALNPVLRIGTQVEETLRVHRMGTRREMQQKALDSLRRAGLPEPEAIYNESAHRLSGGMRQRAAIAAAIVANPKCIIADEPTTALDAALRLQILALFQSLRRDTGASIIMISHDLARVADFADRVFVFYAGRIVESGATREVFSKPAHPYTKSLLENSGIVVSIGGESP